MQSFIWINIVLKGPPDGCSESSDDAHCVPVTTYVDPKDLSITDEEKELMRMAATAAAALAEDADVEPPGIPIFIYIRNIFNPFFEVGTWVIFEKYLYW